LREMLARSAGAKAILLGPWLGALRALGPRLSEAVGVPVGEVLGDVGGAAGLRFEAARASLLQTVGVRTIPYRVVGLTCGDEIHLTLENGEEVVTDRVVLAVGGVAAGGVVYDAPEQHAGTDIPERGGPPWRLSVDLAAPMQAHGRVLDVVGSIHGPPLDQVAWPVDADPGFLEAVGVRCDGLAVLGANGGRIVAAGDVVADKPRTVLQAVFSGVRAGAAAAGEPGTLIA